MRSTEDPDCMLTCAASEGDRDPTAVIAIPFVCMFVTFKVSRKPMLGYCSARIYSYSPDSTEGEILMNSLRACKCGVRGSERIGSLPIVGPSKPRVILVSLVSVRTRVSPWLNPVEATSSSKSICTLC